VVSESEYETESESSETENGLDSGKQVNVTATDAPITAAPEAKKEFSSSEYETDSSEYETDSDEDEKPAIAAAQITIPQQASVQTANTESQSESEEASESEDESESDKEHTEVTQSSHPANTIKVDVSEDSDSSSSSSDSFHPLALTEMQRKVAVEEKRPIAQPSGLAKKYGSHLFQQIIYSTLNSKETHL
jgi:nucleolin